MIDSANHGEVAYSKVDLCLRNIYILSSELLQFSALWRFFFSVILHQIWPVWIEMVRYDLINEYCNSLNGNLCNFAS